LRDQDQKPIKVRVRIDGRFAFGAIFLFFFLLTDLIMYYQGYIPPFTLSGPAIGRGLAVLYPLNVGEELLRIPIERIGTVSRPGSPDDDPDRHTSTKWPSLEFELEKKDSVNELLLRDLHLTVTSYNDERKDKRLEYHRSITVFSDSNHLENGIYFELRKQNDKPPWVFRPTKVIDGTETRPWTPIPLSFTEKARVRLKMIVHAADPGVYTFTVGSEFGSDLNLTYRKELTSEPVSFLYLSERDPSSMPTEGEELKYIGPVGHRRTQPAIPNAEPIPAPPPGTRSSVAAPPAPN